MEGGEGNEIEERGMERKAGREGERGREGEEGRRGEGRILVRIQRVWTVYGLCMLLLLW